MGSINDVEERVKQRHKALNKLKENEVTLIVSDWMMPRMDGVEFCKATMKS